MATTFMICINEMLNEVIVLCQSHLFLAPAVTVGERRELWILPPFFFASSSEGSYGFYLRFFFASSFAYNFVRK